MYKLAKIDEGFLDQKWQDLFALRQKQQPQIEFGYKTWQSYKKTILEDYGYLSNYIDYAITEQNDNIIGEFYCYEDENESENIGRVLRPTIYLLPEFQKDEIIRIIFEKLAEHYDHSLKIRFISNNGMHDEWPVRWGGCFKIHVDNHQLKYEDVDVKKLKDWTETARENYPGFRLRFCQRKDLTETELTEYLYLWNQGLDFSLSNDVIEKYNIKYQIPISMIQESIKDNKANKFTDYSVILYDKNGTVAGVSQFDRMDLKSPAEFKNGKRVVEFLEKGMTYIKPELRGKGFGKWLISELYLKLFDDFVFTEINSTMAPYNSYILNINKEIGFKKQEGVSIREYIFDLREIADRI